MDSLGGGLRRTGSEGGGGGGGKEEGGFGERQTSLTSCRPLSLIDDEVARQVDARYKQTLNNLTSGKAGRHASSARPRDDNDYELMMRAEDVRRELKNTLYPSDISFVPGALRRVSSCSDLESVKTEDFEDQFESVAMAAKRSGLRNQPSKYGSVDRKQPAKYQYGEDQLYPNGLGDSGRTSKHLALVPITKFDRFLVDSDVDTVCSQVVREKLSAPYQENNEFVRFSGTADEGVSSFQRRTSDRRPLTSQGYASRPNSRRRLAPVSLSRPLGGDLTSGFGVSDSKDRMALRNKIDLEVSLKLQGELSKLQAELGEAMIAKEELTQCVARLQSQTKGYQATLENADKQLKNSRTEMELVRAKTIEAEFKLDTAKKELEKVSAELSAAKSVSQLRLASFSLPVAQTAKPENSSAGAAERSIGSKPLEGKTVDYIEQQQLRQNVKNLQEELESKCRLITEHINKRGEMEEKLSSLELQCRQMESEKLDYITEKARECENARLELRSQLIKSQEELSRDVNEVRKQLRSATETATEARTDAINKERLNAQLIEQVLCLQRELEAQSRRHESLLDENVRHLKTIIKDQETTIESTKSRWKEEQNEMTDSLRRTLEDGYNQSLQLTRQQHKQEIDALSIQINERASKIAILRERARRQDEWLHQLIETINQETHDQYWTLLLDEKDEWDVAKEAELARHVTSMREEMIDSVKRLRQELEQERDKSNNYQQQTGRLRAELDLVRQFCGQLEQQLKQREKQQQLEQEQLEKLSAQMQQRQKPNEEKTVQSKDVVTSRRMTESAEAQKVRAEKLERENEMLMSRQRELDHKQRHQQEEYISECFRLVDILEKPIVDSSISEELSSTRDKLNSSDADVIDLSTATLRHLTRIVDEVKRRLNNQRDELQRQKQNIVNILQQSKEDTKELKRKFDAEKRLALDKLKADLTNDHVAEVGRLRRCLGGSEGDAALRRALADKDEELAEIQRNMVVWKERTTNNLAQKFRQEMNRQITERHSAPPNVMSSSGDVITHDSTLFRPPPQLQLVTSSTVNLTPSEILSSKLAKKDQVDGKAKDDVYQLRELQRRAERAEDGFRLANRRANENEHLLNQKLIEMSNLRAVSEQKSKQLEGLQRICSRLARTNVSY